MPMLHVTALTACLLTRRSKANSSGSLIASLPACFPQNCLTHRKRCLCYHGTCVRKNQIQFHCTQQPQPSAVLVMESEATKLVQTHFLEFCQFMGLHFTQSCDSGRRGQLIALTSIVTSHLEICRPRPILKLSNS
jgi:hypothetical protein